MTVLMACYNVRNFVDEQVASILGQSYREITLVMRDDGSTDGSLEYLRERYGGHPQVMVEENGRNLGVVKTFERLLQNVRTEYFALSDHDDVWAPDKIEASVEMLETTGADLSYSDLTIVDRELRVMHPSKWKYSKTPPFAGHEYLRPILKNPVSGCTIVGRRSLLERALPFPDAVPMHDRWLTCVAAAGGGVAFIPRSTILYRQHGGNDSGGFPYGVRGLRMRVRRDTQGKLGAYLKRRRGKRLGLIEGLMSRGVVDGDLAFLRTFYRGSWGARVLRSARYARLLMARGPELGLGAIAADVLLSIAPDFIRPERHAP